MRTVLAVALLVALSGVTLVVATAPAAACIPYSVCDAMQRAKCTLAQDDVLDAPAECFHFIGP